LVFLVSYIYFISEKNSSQNQSKIAINEEQATSSNNEINKNDKIEQKKE